MKQPSTPVDLLNALIKEYGLSIAKISEDTKLSPSMIRQLISGKTKLTPATAAKLDKYFGFKSGYWLLLQYETDLKELKSDKELQGFLKTISKAKKQKAPAEKKSAKKDAPAALSKARGKGKAAASAPKTRGRKSSAGQIELFGASEPKTEPKKRGRRPKAGSLEASLAKAPEEAAAAPVSAEPKKRGRKPKPVSMDAPEKKPGKRGRKPKVAAVIEPEQNEPEFKAHSILIKQDGRVIDSRDLPVNNAEPEDDNTNNTVDEFPDDLL